MTRPILIAGGIGSPYTRKMRAVAMGHARDLVGEFLRYCVNLIRCIRLIVNLQTRVSRVHYQAA